MRPGDDASCLNLYQPTQPRALGITPALIQHGGFAWATSAAQDSAERDNPWLLLDKDLPPGPDGIAVAPVVLDMNTALYSLHLWKGVGETFEIKDGRGEKLRLIVVGLLKNSIFQGDLLLPNSNSSATSQKSQATASSSSMCRSAKFRISNLKFQIPNPATLQLLKPWRTSSATTASTPNQPWIGWPASWRCKTRIFRRSQSLGGLGLLLGTLGLATVQLRSVFKAPRRITLHI